MSATIRVNGIELTVVNGEWIVSSEDMTSDQSWFAEQMAEIAPILIKALYEPSGSDLNPDRTMAEIVAASMRGEVLSFTEPVLVPGRLY